MSVAEIIQLLSGPGTATIAFVVMFLTGMVHTRGEMEDKDKQIAAKTEEIRELKQALTLERQRSDSAILTGTIVRDVMTELRREVR